MSVSGCIDDILRFKGRRVHAIAPEASTDQAVREMNDLHIGALLVMHDGRMLGMFSERDVLTRIVAQGHDPRNLMVAEVMTRGVITVPSKASIEHALSIVTEARCRHLPVVDDGELVGLVSSGDLQAWIVEQQGLRIDDLVRYITAA